MARSISAHAAAIACSLGLEVTFVRVIDVPGRFAFPADPIDWQLRRRAQREDLQRLAGCKASRDGASSVLLAGSPEQEITDWARDHGATILATGCRRCEQGRGMGHTTRSLLERREHSLLVIPHGLSAQAQYRRIMVPLDGSDSGDAVLPVARRIARTYGADLVLTHVVPHNELIEPSYAPQVGQLSPDLQDQKRLKGMQHLQTLHKRSKEEGIEVHAITRGPGDPRLILGQTALAENIDLIVMASHGCTGLADVACGSVTEYLANHSPVPLLIVRPNLQCSFGGELADCRNTSAFRSAK
jgi:nucleotide-binding universal stress UspA family protein